MGYFSDIIHDSHIPARPAPTADVAPWTAPPPEVDRPQTDPIAETPSEGVERPEIGERTDPTQKGKRRGDFDIETTSAETAVEARHSMEGTTPPETRKETAAEVQVQSAGEWGGMAESSREKPPPVVATVHPAGLEPERSPLRHPFLSEEADGRVESKSANRPVERFGPNGAPPAVEAAGRESGPPVQPAGPSPERPEAPMAAPRQPVLARVQSDPPRSAAADQGETRPDAYGTPGEWRADPGPPTDAGSGARKTSPSPAPPQVRIGQVNVIVESPKPPSGPTGPERRGIDRNRRIFLRSL